MQPLNPSLYASLKRRFKHVKISNAGQQMIAQYLPGPDGRLRLHPLQKGEYYVVCCPQCNDSSGHLYINHRWGVRDPENGTYNLWLMYCHREGCMREYPDQKDLFDSLGGTFDNANVGTVILQDSTELPPLNVYELPADFRLLSDLHRDSVPNQYLIARHFNTTELSEVWGVGFSRAIYRKPPGRIVIPLRAYFPDFDPEKPSDAPGTWEIVGYQGRALTKEDEKEAKYMTSAGTQKSRILYGLDQVPSNVKTPVIVCEWPSDVWRAGPGAVAILGKHISDAQCKLLREMVPGRDIVVMLDGDATADSIETAEQIQAVLERDMREDVTPGSVVVAALPDKRDPGDCTRPEIWALAAMALKQSKRRDR